jgi:plasmid replication initiation protein
MNIKHNKDLIQSYVLTTAKYNFSTTEKRILYRIVEVLQSKTKGLKLNYDYSIQEDLFKNTEFVMPLSCFFPDDGAQNYRHVKDSLISLRQKGFEFEDDKTWGYYGIIESPIIEKYKGVVNFKVTPLLMDAFLDFSKGYRKYELKIAMNFESIYAMRFYELLSGKKEPITYGINYLKELFSITDKYTNRPYDFIKHVVLRAQSELTEKSPYSFSFDSIKTGRKVTHLTFKPYFIPENRDEDLENEDLEKQISLRYTFSKETIEMLKSRFSFTDKGIKNNINTIKEAVERLDFLDECSDINGMIRKYEVNNPSGFFISELKKRLENSPSITEKENKEKILNGIKKIASKKY